MLFITIISLLTVTIFLGTLSFPLEKIEGHSMEPTLKDGERIVVNRLAYGVTFFNNKAKKPFYFIWKEPAVNDIIILRDPFSGKRYIKRIAAKGGDILEKRKNRLALAGGSSEWEIEEGKKWLKQSTIPPLTYFVVGDNLENSHDSRHFGLVAFHLIEGKAIVRRK